MPEHDEPTTTKVITGEAQLTHRLRVFGVLFRVVLVAGLVLLIAAIVLLIVTDLFFVWILLLPFGLIALGIVLARMEYRLHMRLYQLQNQGPSNDVY